MKLYAIDENQLAMLKRAYTRLHTEKRMDGDQMRDMGHALQAIVDVVSQLEIPERVPSSDDEVEFEVHMERNTFNALRTAMMIRMMAAETSGVIEAFVHRFIKCVDEGKQSYNFKLKKDPT